MDDSQIQTMDQVRRFVEGNDGVEFKRQSGQGAYEWVESTLRRFGYERLERPEKGVIRRFISRVTGYSRAQVSRLIGEHQRKGRLQRQQYRRHRFAARYSRWDMALLAKTDEAHGYLSGPATKKVLEREYMVYGHDEYGNICRISVAHLYNLRNKNIELGLTRRFTKTRPTQLAIGERVKPDTRGEPGHIRVDTVHQGDLNGAKGVYHVNAVDEETQWEVVVSVQKISEGYLLPMLEEMLKQFPFVIKGFHTDNGSEFINRVVAELLNKLNARFTKSRPRHSNDNALIECKNGWVVRKNLGYGYIPQHYAGRLSAYYREFLNPYINFHRPCFFPVVIVNAKGKVEKKYPYQQVMTPYERLKTLPGVERHLAPGISMPSLDAIASEMSDNECAERMAQARDHLMGQIWSSKSEPGEPQGQGFPLVPNFPKKRKGSKKKETITAAASPSPGSLFD